MQNILADYLLFTSQHLFVTNNVAWMYSWECDLISINKNNMLYEYEIKISRADFKQDFKKRKHIFLENKYQGYHMPNYFSYVINGFDVDISELPKYAGLIKIEGDTVIRVKNPQKLHKEEPMKCDIRLLTKGISIRYWKLRNSEQMSLGL